ncbi:MAG: sigma-70 family RNA polymerase sigma factor [Cytophagales bacterium]|nr:sigma-70 family RNA polymerase sigma factor [Cytophagales bacterium]
MQTKETVNQRLINGIKNSCQKIVNQVYKDYYPSISNFVLKNQGTPEAAQDIFQEGLIVIYRKSLQGDFHISCSFHTYLYAICKNLWYKELRKKGRYVQEVHENTHVIDANEIYKLQEKQERYELFRRKFKELNEDCQKILFHFFEKKSMKEITEIMGFKNEGYTKKRKFKCKEKLVKLIREDSIFAELVN